IAVQCMDDAFIASYDIAVNKAFTVVSLKMPTKNLATLAAPGGSLYGIQFTNNGKIIIFGGGEPLCGKDGAIIGGLGVSGGTAEQDTYLGEYGKEFFENLI
ncbi:MAG: heme-binding protein, partial [Clostridia bacterium]|nr:heme-binding protein [Clostridia bacterium]